LHLHGVVAVWVLNRDRGVGDITRQLGIIHLTKVEDSEHACERS
jgi:hypothetical protein